LDSKKHVLIIGGGIFGLTTAIVLGEHGLKVTLVEKNKDIMQEASLVNQNRIHYGYHYPRSKGTVEEALIGLNTFKEFYGESIYDSFDKYYAIGKRGSHLNAEEFYTFCQNLGLSLKEAYPPEEILDPSMVEACWLTPEPIFDYHKLKQMIIYRIAKNKNIRVVRNTQPISINHLNGEKEVILTNGYKVRCDAIISATYAGIADIVDLFNRDKVKAKFQLCVMPILEMDSPPKPFGVTVMDGPFCSLMPKGFNKGHFILYHVTHSVIQEHIGYHSVDWSPIDGFIELDIMEHSKDFYPILNKMKLRDSWITTRIVLPDQEMDDARPTLFLDHGKDIYSIFSGKLTTCVDVANEALIKLGVAG
jgi:glycine/D-amino acid oxidase-like deaminating enzyme